MAPLRCSGRTRTSCLSSPLRLRGRQGYKHTCACVLHFDFGVEQACFAAAWVTSSPAPLGPLLRSRLAVRLSSLLRGVISCRGAPPADLHFLWVRSPFFGSYVFFPRSSMRVQFLFGGGRTRFPDRDCVRVHSHLWEGVPGGFFLARGSHNFGLAFWMHLRMEAEAKFSISRRNGSRTLSGIPLMRYAVRGSNVFSFSIEVNGSLSYLFGCSLKWIRHSFRSHLGVSHHLEAEWPRRLLVRCTSLTIWRG